MNGKRGIAMSKTMMNTKEVAEYLGIHEKQVYALIKAGRIPCTRVTGKWLFPNHLIDEWIISHAQKSISKASRKDSRAKKYILASGSNDPILDILLSNTKQSHPEIYIFTCNNGSTSGLQLLSDDLTDIAWCHFLDPQSNEHNIPYISSYFNGKDIAVVHLFYREQGFLVSPESPHQVKEFNHLTLPGVVFINRQGGSGTRIFLDYNLQKEGIDPSSIIGYENEVNTHFEIGLAILSGKAHVGIATIAVSKLFGLPFVPIMRESFNMVVTKATFFEKGVQAFIEILNSGDFRQKVKPLGNYDFSKSGNIIYSSIL